MISCDVIQWRRIRRKVLFEGKPINLVAMQESLTVEVTREMLTLRPKPKGDPGQRTSLFSTAIPYTGLARGDRELLQWAQWLYSLEQDELAYPPFGAELSRHGAAARKRMLSVLAREEGFGLKASSVVDPDDDRLTLANDALISHVERAMRSIGALAERLGIRSIEREMSRARSDRAALAETTREYEGEIFSGSLAKARVCFAPLRIMADVRAITAQGVLRNLLEKTAVILADQGISPTNEADVRNAVLKACNYAFPDSAKEIGIPQILKHSRGDIGVRSLRTMVEFKFIDNQAEMQIALEGIHADMMGYRHPDWDTFYGVFYMTGPFYVQADVQRQFEFIAADRSWTPIVVQGHGARPVRARKSKAST